MNGIRPKLLVEPFAGGASVSLELLSRRLVESIAIGERDPLVASFWKIVFRDPEWLIHQIETIRITLENWDYFRNCKFRTDRERALACLFLNRTSFSGILARRAGPLGGRRQVSAYTLACRFPVGTLSRRIRQAAAMKNRVVFVNQADWETTLRKATTLGLNRRDIFYYLDPPFYQKADRLYRYCFDDNEHLKLYDSLTNLKSPWLLSYDPDPFIYKLYSKNGREPQHVHLIYSASSSKQLVASREIVVTNLPRLPKETRLWRTNDEWQKRVTGTNGAVLPPDYPTHEILQ